MLRFLKGLPEGDGTEVFRSAPWGTSELKGLWPQLWGLSTVSLFSQLERTLAKTGDMFLLFGSDFVGRRGYHVLSWETPVLAKPVMALTVSQSDKNHLLCSASVTKPSAYFHLRK